MDRLLTCVPREKGFRQPLELSDGRLGMECNVVLQRLYASLHKLSAKVLTSIIGVLAARQCLQTPLFQATDKCPCQYLNQCVNWLERIAILEKVFVDAFLELSD